MVNKRNMMKHEKDSFSQRISIAFALVACVFIAAPAAIADEHETHDGLVQVPNARVGAAYADPDADFGVYNKIMMLDCAVAFKKDWQKKQQRTGSRISVSSSDIEKIKTEVAIMFREVFAEELSKDGGYEIVDEPGDDVLLVRPAIIDLNISAPESMQAGRTRTYTAESLQATVFIELYDSVTGDILARAADRRVARQAGNYLSYTNRVTNQADGRRMMRTWARKLREALDEYHGK